jgi:hypothetical protein
MTTEQRPWAGDEIPPGCGVIEVRVAELAQFFNSMDPSPFHEKDLDEDAEEFIVSSAKEMGAEKPLALLVHLDKATVMPDAGHALSDAVHAFFARRSMLTRRRLQERFRTGRISLAIGLLFLAASLIGGDWLARLYPASALANLVKESAIIGGWVAMWRPLEIFLYDWWPILNERRVYDRLSRMPVRIVCTGERTQTAIS